MVDGRLSIASDGGVSWLDHVPSSRLFFREDEDSHTLAALSAFLNRPFKGRFDQVLCNILWLKPRIKHTDSSSGGRPERPVGHLWFVTGSPGNPDRTGEPGGSVPRSVEAGRIRWLGWRIKEVWSEMGVTVH